MRINLDNFPGASPKAPVRINLDNFPAAKREEEQPPQIDANLPTDEAVEDYNPDEENVVYEYANALRNAHDSKPPKHDVPKLTKDMLSAWMPTGTDPLELPGEKDYRNGVNPAEDDLASWADRYLVAKTIDPNNPALGYDNTISSLTAGTIGGQAGVLANMEEYYGRRDNAAKLEGIAQALQDPNPITVDIKRPYSPEYFYDFSHGIGRDASNVTGSSIALGPLSALNAATAAPAALALSGGLNWFGSVLPGYSGKAVKTAANVVPALLLEISRVDPESMAEAGGVMKQVRARMEDQGEYISEEIEAAVKAAGEATRQANWGILTTSNLSEVPLYWLAAKVPGKIPKGLSMAAAMFIDKLKEGGEEVAQRVVSDVYGDGKSFPQGLSDLTEEQLNEFYPAFYGSTLGAVGKAATALLMTQKPRTANRDLSEAEKLYLPSVAQNILPGTLERTVGGGAEAITPIAQAPQEYQMVSMNPPPRMPNVPDAPHNIPKQIPDVEPVETPMNGGDSGTPNATAQQQVPNIEPVETPFADESVRDRAQNLTPQFQAAMPWIGGMLRNLVGDGWVVTSTWRSKEQNDAAKGAENSYHMQGDAADFALPDGMSDEEVQRVLDAFKATGAFKEVLYHDAGSGKHLHLAGFTGSVNGQSFSIADATQVTDADMRGLLQSVMDEDETDTNAANIAGDTNAADIANVTNNAANANTADEQDNAIQEYLNKALEDTESGDYDAFDTAMQGLMSEQAEQGDEADPSMQNLKQDIQRTKAEAKKHRAYLVGAYPQLAVKAAQMSAPKPTSPRGKQRNMRQELKNLAQAEIDREEKANNGQTTERSQRLRKALKAPDAGMLAQEVGREYLGRQKAMNIMRSAPLGKRGVFRMRPLPQGRVTTPVPNAGGAVQANAMPVAAQGIPTVATTATVVPGVSGAAAAAPQSYADYEGIRAYSDADVGSTVSALQESQRTVEGAKGHTDTIRTDDGTKIKVQYALVEAENITPSNDAATMRENGQYPAQLQPRNRANRAALLQQITSMAQNLDPELVGRHPNVNQGAPVTLANGVVLNGNGRAIAIQRAYAANDINAANYKQYLLENAEDLGFSRDDVMSMSHPMLVRVVTQKLDAKQARAAIESNAGGAAMSETERATNDASKFTPELFQLYKDDTYGDLTKESNRGFVLAVIRAIATNPSELNNLLTANGKDASQAGIRRVRNALVAKAYGNDAVVGRMMESTDDRVKSISNALEQAAPQVARDVLLMENGKLREHPLRESVAAAVRTIAALRDKLTGKDRKTVDEYLSEGFVNPESTDTAETRAVMSFIDKHRRNTKHLREFIKGLAARIEQEGDPSAESLFNMGEPATFMDMIMQTWRKVVADNQLNEQIPAAESFAPNVSGASAAVNKELTVNAYDSEKVKANKKVYNTIFLPLFSASGRAVSTDIAAARKLPGARKWRMPNGDIYAYVSGDTAYLDMTKVDAKSALYCYTHLWYDCLRHDNPELARRGVELTKTLTDEWNEIANDPLYAGFADDDYAIAGELIARYAGKNGAARLNEAASKYKDNAAGIIGSIKGWLENNFLKGLRDMFTRYTKAEADAITWEQYQNMPLLSLVSKTDLAAKGERFTEQQETERVRSFNEEFALSCGFKIVHDTRTYLDSDGVMHVSDDPGACQYLYAPLHLEAIRRIDANKYEYGKTLLRDTDAWKSNEQAHPEWTEEQVYSETFAQLSAAKGTHDLRMMVRHIGNDKALRQRIQFWLNNVWGRLQKFLSRKWHISKVAAISTDRFLLTTMGSMSQGIDPREVQPRSVSQGVAKYAQAKAYDHERRYKPDKAEELRRMSDAEIIESDEYGKGVASLRLIDAPAPDNPLVLAAPQKGIDNRIKQGKAQVEYADKAGIPITEKTRKSALNGEVKGVKKLAQVLSRLTGGALTADEIADIRNAAQKQGVDASTDDTSELLKIGRRVYEAARPETPSFTTFTVGTQGTSVCHVARLKTKPSRATLADIKALAESYNKGRTDSQRPVRIGYDERLSFAFTFHTGREFNDFLAKAEAFIAQDERAEEPSVERKKSSLLTTATPEGADPSLFYANVPFKTLEQMKYGSLGDLAEKYNSLPYGQLTSEGRSYRFDSAAARDGFYNEAVKIIESDTADYQQWQKNAAADAKALQGDRQLPTDVVEKAGKRVFKAKVAKEYAPLVGGAEYSGKSEAERDAFAERANQTVREKLAAERENNRAERQAWLEKDGIVENSATEAGYTIPRAVYRLLSREGKQALRGLWSRNYHVEGKDGIWNLFPSDEIRDANAKMVEQLIKADLGWEYTDGKPEASQKQENSEQANAAGATDEQAAANLEQATAAITAHLTESEKSALAAGRAINLRGVALVAKSKLTAETRQLMGEAKDYGDYVGVVCESNRKCNALVDRINREHPTGLMADDELNRTEKWIADFAEEFFDLDVRFTKHLLGGAGVVHADVARTGEVLVKHRANDNKALLETFWHETFHFLKASNPELYGKILDKVQEAGLITDEQLAVIARRWGNKAATRERMIEEMLAENMMKVVQRKAFARNLAKADKALAKEYCGWLKRLLNTVKTFMNEKPDPYVMTKEQFKAFEQSVIELIAAAGGRQTYSVAEYAAETSTLSAFRVEDNTQWESTSLFGDEWTPMAPPKRVRKPRVVKQKERKYDAGDEQTGLVGMDVAEGQTSLFERSWEDYADEEEDAAPVEKEENESTNTLTEDENKKHPIAVPNAVRRSEPAELNVQDDSRGASSRNITQTEAESQDGFETALRNAQELSKQELASLLGMDVDEDADKLRFVRNAMRKAIMGRKLSEDETAAVEMVVKAEPAPPRDAADVEADAERKLAEADVERCIESIEDADNGDVVVRVKAETVKAMDNATRAELLGKDYKMLSDGSAEARFDDGQAVREWLNRGNGRRLALGDWGTGKKAAAAAMISATPEKRTVFCAAYKNDDGSYTVEIDAAAAALLSDKEVDELCGHTAVRLANNAIRFIAANAGDAKARMSLIDETVVGKEASRAASTATETANDELTEKFRDFASDRTILAADGDTAILVDREFKRELYNGGDFYIRSNADGVVLNDTMFPAKEWGRPVGTKKNATTFRYEFADKETRDRLMNAAQDALDAALEQGVYKGTPGERSKAAKAKHITTGQRQVAVEGKSRPKTMYTATLSRDLTEGQRERVTGEMLQGFNGTMVDSNTAEFANRADMKKYCSQVESYLKGKVVNRHSVLEVKENEDSVSTQRTGEEIVKYPAESLEGYKGEIDEILQDHDGITQENSADGRYVSFYSANKAELESFKADVARLMKEGYSEPVVRGEADEWNVYIGVDFLTSRFGEAGIERLEKQHDVDEEGKNFAVRFEDEKKARKFASDLAATLRFSADDNTSQAELNAIFKNAKAVDDTELTDDERGVVGFCAKFGLTVQFVETDSRMKGAYNKGVAYVNRGMDTAQTLWHEALHMLHDLDAALYDRLAKAANITDGQIDKWLEDNPNRNLDREGTRQEILADLMSEGATRIELMRTFGRNDESVARKLLEWLKTWYNSIAAHFSKHHAQVKAIRDELVRINRELRGKDSKPIYSGEDFTGNKGLLDTIAQHYKNADDNVRFSVRKEPPPKKTLRMYKLFNVDEDGSPMALFIDAANKLTTGVWYNADAPNAKNLEKLEAGRYYLMDMGGNIIDDAVKRPGKAAVDKATAAGQRWVTARQGKNERLYYTVGKNGSGTVAEFALRPGWHATNAPSARHIGEAENGKVSYRKANQRWFEVEIAADVDYNEQARQRYAEAHPNMSRAEIDAALKGDLQTIPTDGFYDFQTNSNANPQQRWVISGAMRIVRALSDEEAARICGEKGIERDLPRRSAAASGNERPRASRMNAKERQTLNGLANGRPFVNPYDRHTALVDKTDYDALPDDLRQRIDAAERVKTFHGYIGLKFATKHQCGEFVRAFEHAAPRIAIDAEKHSVTVPETALPARKAAALKVKHGMKQRGHVFTGDNYQAFADEITKDNDASLLDSELTKTELGVVKFAEEVFDVDVRFAKQLEDDSDAGCFSGEDKSIRILRDKDVDPVSTMWHELFHFLAASEPELHKSLVGAIQKAGVITKEQLAEIERRWGDDAATMASKIEELCAENMIVVAKRNDLMKQLSQSDPDLAKQFALWVKRLLNTVKRWVNSKEKPYLMTKAQYAEFERGVVQMVIAARKAVSSGQYRGEKGTLEKPQNRLAAKPKTDNNADNETRRQQVVDYVVGAVRKAVNALQEHGVSDEEISELLSEENGRIREYVLREYADEHNVAFSSASKRDRLGRLLRDDERVAKMSNADVADNLKNIQKETEVKSREAGYVFAECAYQFSQAGHSDAEGNQRVFRGFSSPGEVDEAAFGHRGFSSFAKIQEDVDQLVFSADDGASDAALADAVRNAKAIDDADLTEDEQRAKSALARWVDVKFVAADKLNGYFDGKHTVYVNRNAKLGLTDTIFHEITHVLAAQAPDLHADLIKAAGITEEQRQAYRAKLGRELTDAQIDGEIVADAMMKLMPRHQLFCTLGRNDESLAKRFVLWIKRLFNSIKADPRSGLDRAQMRDLDAALNNAAAKLGRRVITPSELHGEKGTLTSWADIEDATYDKWSNEAIKQMDADMVAREIGELTLPNTMTEDECDELRDKLPIIHKLTTWTNKKYIQENEPYFNRISCRLWHMRRCFDNDPRIKSRIVRPNASVNGQGRNDAVGSSAFSRRGQGGFGANGNRVSGEIHEEIRLTAVPTERGLAAERFRALCEDTAKEMKWDGGSFSTGSSQRADEIMRRLYGKDEKTAWSKMSDLGSWLYAQSFQPAYDLAKQDKVFRPFYLLARRFKDAEAKITSDYKKRLKNAIEYVNSNGDTVRNVQDAEEYDKINKVMVQGAKDGKEYTLAELKAKGFTDGMCRAYQAVRDVFNELGARVCAEKEYKRKHEKFMSQAEIDAAKRDKFFVPNSLVVNGTKTDTRGNSFVSYETYETATRKEDCTSAQLDYYYNSPNEEIVGKPKPIKGSNLYSAIIQYRKPTLAMRPGFVPVVRDAYGVFLVDDDGNKLKCLATFHWRDHNFTYLQDKLHGRSVDAAAQWAQRYKKDHPNDKIEIIQARNSLEEMFDPDYGQGYIDDDLTRVAETFVGAAAHYLAMEKGFRAKAVARFNRRFGSAGDFHAAHAGKAEYVQKYVNFVLGNPVETDEKMNDAFSFADPLAARRFISSTTGFTAHACIGTYNVATSAVNTLQLMNAAVELEDPMALPKGFAIGMKAVAHQLSAEEESVLSETGLWDKMNLAEAISKEKFDRDVQALYERAWNTFLEKGLWFFEKSEQVTRVGCTLLAYNKAISEGKTHRQAIRYAKFVDDQCNFDFRDINTIALMRKSGMLGRLVFQFGKYKYNQIAFSKNIVLHGTNKQRAIWAGQNLLLGGYRTFIPGFWFASAVLGAVGEPPEPWLDKWIIDHFGTKSLGKTMLYGMGAAVANIDISRRMDTNVGDVMYNDLTRNLGPSIGRAAQLALDLYNNADFDGEGRFKKLHTPPEVFLRNVSSGLYNAYLAYQGERRDKNGNVLEKYTGTGRLTRAMGFANAQYSLERDTAKAIEDENKDPNSAYSDAVKDLTVVAEEADKHPSAENGAKVDEYVERVKKRGRAAHKKWSQVKGDIKRAKRAARKNDEPSPLNRVKPKTEEQAELIRKVRQRDDENPKAKALQEAINAVPLSEDEFARKYKAYLDAGGTKDEFLRAAKKK